MKDNQNDKTREKVTDPVCNMTFATRKAAATAEYGGVVYHFCTEACQKQFVEEPERYALQP